MRKLDLLRGIGCKHNKSCECFEMIRGNLLLTPELWESNIPFWQRSFCKFDEMFTESVQDFKVMVASSAVTHTAFNCITLEFEELGHFFGKML